MDGGEIWYENVLFDPQTKQKKVKVKYSLSTPMFKMDLSSRSNRQVYMFRFGMASKITTYSGESQSGAILLIQPDEGVN